MVEIILSKITLSNSLIKPAVSASSINISGLTKLPSSSCQRANASKPTGVNVAKSIFGCKATCNVLAPITLLNRAIKLYRLVNASVFSWVCLMYFNDALWLSLKLDSAILIIFSGTIFKTELSAKSRILKSAYCFTEVIIHFCLIRLAIIPSVISKFAFISNPKLLLLIMAIRAE